MKAGYRHNESADHPHGGRHSRHMRTATAQYVGPPQAQFYHHQNGSAPVVANYTQAVPQHTAQPYGMVGAGYQPNLPPNGAQMMQQPVMHPMLYYGNMQNPPHTQHAIYSNLGQATSPPSSNGTDIPHAQPEPPRPPSVQQQGHSKQWPYNSRFKPPDPDAFNTWSLNERGGRDGNAESAPQEKQYTFVQFDGGNGSSTPERQPPKSAGLSSSYNKIEFLNTSPQAFRRESTSSVC